MTNFLTLRNSPLSTLNALNLNYSTLTGSTLTSRNVQFSTLTGSTLINTVISTNTVIATSTVTGSIGIFHNSLGAAAPTVGISGGAGERLILWPGTSATYPYSIGINGSTLWYSVPSGAQHNWYVGGASKLSLSNTLLSLTASILISGSSLTFANTTINANIAWGNQNFIAQASTEGQWVADALAADMVLRTTANAIRFTTNNGTSSAMVINTSGQVGIGKTNPSSLLHLHSTSGSIHRATGLNIYTPQAGIVLDSTQSSGGRSWNIWSEIGAGSNPGGLNIYDSTVGEYRFTINSSGNVGIGILNADYKLDVVGSARMSSLICSGNSLHYFGYDTPTAYNVSGGSYGSSLSQAGIYYYFAWTSSSQSSPSLLASTSHVGSVRYMLYNGTYTITFACSLSGASAVELFISKNLHDGSSDLNIPGKTLAIGAISSTYTQTVLSWTGYLSTSDFICVGVYVGAGTGTIGSRSSLSITLIQRAS